jgi:hypothetical protein
MGKRNITPKGVLASSDDSTDTRQMAPLREVKSEPKPRCVMGWWKPYNVSGTIHVESRKDELCGVVREVLRANYVYLIRRLTGEMANVTIISRRRTRAVTVPTEPEGEMANVTTIQANSGLGFFISSGFELHEFYVHVKGTHSEWERFANQFEEALAFANFPYSIMVHDQIINEKKQE